MKTVEGTFFFDPADRIYQVHFPQRPVVPGSLIIQAFLQAALVDLERTDFRQVERFRFKKFVTPGTYHYMLDDQDNVVKCRLLSGEQILVTGRLKK